MLTKKPKDTFLKKGFSLFIAFEAACFLGAYTVWYKANRDREFRYYLHQNIPVVLDYYYKTGEVFDEHNKARETDLKVWASQGKKI